jgi:pilus assembly protein Flp/PilA
MHEMGRRLRRPILPGPPHRKGARGFFFGLEHRMAAFWSRLRRDERGATAIEYGLIVALISILVIAAVSATGQVLWNTLEAVSTAVKG